MGESVLTNFEQKKFSPKLLFLKYPIPEIPEDFENKSGTDRVLKKISGSGRVSGTRWSLASGDRQISLSASVESAFANFRVKNFVFTHFCAVLSMH